MRPLIVRATIVSLVIAACGGGGAGVEEETGSSEPETSESGDETMADFFGYGSTDDPEAQQAEFQAQEARIQESIRQCMAGSGFEYQPILPPQGSFVVYDETNEEERVRTQGFGITTWYGNEETTDTTSMAEEWVDPNQEMLEAMSQSEQDAWYAALYGTQEEQMEGSHTEVDPETGEEYVMTEGYGAGCQGEAYEAEYGEMNNTEDLWAEINPAMEAMYQQVQADPRIVEMDQGWSTCMAAAGYEFESPMKMGETVYEDFQTRFDAIVGANGGYADPFEGWSQEEIEAFMAEKTEEELNAFFQEAEQSAREAIDMDAVAAIQQEEIDLAVADFECREGYNETYQAVSEEYEADFIAANREVLEQIRDAQGG
ncbi:MAG: hypothetical protein M3P87_12025 [Actinomycetota bacterium]|nr:hypothetical protein [Actinomycetota bacterium]